MEIVDLYDDERKLTGETVERKGIIPDGRYKLSMHAWIVNSKNQFYIQKRSANKRILPNLWENLGGCARSGETSEQTFAREFYEELGILPDLNKAKMIYTIKREKDFVDVWFVIQDFEISDLNLQEDEVSEGKWVTIKEINKMIKNRKFCPSFESSFQEFLKFHNNVRKDQKCIEVDL